MKKLWLPSPEDRADPTAMLEKNISRKKTESPLQVCRGSPLEQTKSTSSGWKSLLCIQKNTPICFCLQKYPTFLHVSN